MLASYFTLFGAALLAATLFPAQSELLLAYLLRSGERSWPLLIAVATLGNVLGSLINWLIGRSLERFRDRSWFPVKQATLDRAEDWYRRWGKWSLLLSWMPIIGDPLTLIGGMLRVPIGTFLALVLIAKAGRYIMIALAIAATLPR